MNEKINSISEANQLLGLIDERVDKAINETAKDYLKKKVAIVDDYNEETLVTYVKIPTDENENIYSFYNKTGGDLQIGDYVIVQYTTNFALGELIAKTGEPRIKKQSSGLEPITAITIYSNTDYMISTNAGTERYIAIFEE